MSTRSSRSSRRKKPNPALYVGYVEDDETPDMIMKKFAQMEKLMETSKKSMVKSIKPSSKSDKAEMSESDEEDNNNKNDNKTLTEEQLVSLFNDTSYYSINSLQRNNDIMFQKQTVDEDGFVTEINDPDYQQLMFEVDYNVADTELMDWMDPNEDDYIGEEAFWDDDDKDDKPRRSRSRSGRSMGVKRDRFARFSGHAIGSSSLRKVQRGGNVIETKIFCHEANYLKVPAYPIPRSWLKNIKMYNGYNDLKGYFYIEKNILSMKKKNDFFFSNNIKKEYKAILMDPPFDLNDSPVQLDCDKNKGCIKLEEFKKLPINQVISDTCGAMLFIWVPSELTMQVNDICEEWGFLLVEHAGWICRNLKYQIENNNSNLFGLSKHNLLLYRRTKKNGKSFNKIELRHQRTSDSYFDFVRYHKKTGRELKSDYHYKVIETLLPDLDRKEDGNALFLWAPKNEKREGWTCICDTKQLDMLKRNQPNMDIGDW